MTFGTKGHPTVRLHRLYSRWAWEARAAAATVLCSHARADLLVLAEWYEGRAKNYD